MKKTREYNRTRFSPDILREASRRLFQGVDGELRLYLSVNTQEGCWNHDDEEEFFADYGRSSGEATYQKEQESHSFRVQCLPYGTAQVSVGAPIRSEVESTFNYLDGLAESCRIIDTEDTCASPTVFVGHGRENQWRDLKDHLQDKHGYSVEAYEIGARAGHAIRDILEDMLDRSSFAVLVMTGEDGAAGGECRARQNVVHEAGLFQGRLGFNRAIVLLEDGTEEFSNIKGIQQIRYAKGKIKETFGDVIAVLRREFPGTH